MPRPKRPPPPPPDDDIALANSLSDADFLTSYLLPTSLHPNTPYTPLFTHPTTLTTYTLTLTSSPPIPPCLSLIHLTSRAHYGPLWSPSKKTREMRTPGLRYILIHPVSDPTHLAGFISFLPTYEPFPEAVVYVYEVHLLPELRGGGLGGRLMGVVEEVAGRVRGAGKVMLTCFEENGGAMGFYRGEGFGCDGSCPCLVRAREGGRRLRGGKVTEGPRYCILSKRVEKGGGETGEAPKKEETLEDGKREDGTAAEDTGKGTSKQDEARSPVRKKRRVVPDLVQL